MAERDYKVVYKARPVDYDDYDDGRRHTVRRIPTALDPYDYPNDRDELKRNVAEAKLRSHNPRGGELVDEGYNLHPDDSISVRQEAVGDRILREKMDRSPAGAREGTAAAAGSVTTKTTYSVKKDGAGGDARITGAEKSVLSGSPAGARDRDHDLSLSRYDTASSREYVPMDYDVEPLRRQNGAYVVETRRGDDVDVYVAGRGGEPLRERGDRDFRDDGRYVQVYDDYSRRTPTNTVVRDKRYYRDGYAFDRREEPRSSARSFEVAERVGAPYASGAIYVDDRCGPQRVVHQEIPRSSARVVEEDDWKVVDSRRSSSSQPSMFRDPFHENRLIDSRGRTRGRSFVQHGSDEEYVLVSPPRTRTEGGGGTLRSAMIKEDSYTPEERLQRRRSRSAHFRDRDVPRHMVGEQRHERPGAEAEMMGRYLNHYEDRDRDRDYMDYEYKTSSRRDVLDRDDTYMRSEDDRRYAPQRDSPPSRRRKDHYGGHDEDTYYSDRYERTRDSRYH